MKSAIAADGRQAIFECLAVQTGHIDELLGGPIVQKNMVSGFPVRRADSMR